MELITVAAVIENGFIGRDGRFPWPSIPADKRQYRNRISDEYDGERYFPDWDTSDCPVVDCTFMTTSPSKRGFENRAN